MAAEFHPHEYQLKGLAGVILGQFGPARPPEGEVGQMGLPVNHQNPLDAIEVLCLQQPQEPLDLVPLQHQRPFCEHLDQVDLSRMVIEVPLSALICFADLSSRQKQL